MAAVTIGLYLPRGDANSLRIAQISNWTGLAIAAPRIEFDELLARNESDGAGIYILLGNEPTTNKPQAYIGEAEVVRDRLKQHRGREFWNSAVIVVSKDENLTKAHVRYLENRLLEEARVANRVAIGQNQTSGSRLPESDRDDMEVFLSRIRQLLPVLAADILTPIAAEAAPVPGAQPPMQLIARVKGAQARGRRTATGFVVFRGSTAVGEERPAAGKRPSSVSRRRQLIADGVLVRKGDFWEFCDDVEFSTPSAAAGVIHGGSANGLKEWKSPEGVSLKDLETSE